MARQSELELIVANRLDRAGISYEREYKFHPAFRYRADFFVAWPVQVADSPGILVEVEGGLYHHRSGHRSVSGVLRDIRKANWAQEAGFLYIRVSEKDLHGDGEWLEILSMLLEKNRGD